MLLPKKVKYRKMMKGRIRGTAGQKISLSFGEFGLKSLDSCWVTSRQIEAARRAIMHFLKRGGKLWIRIFPDKPITTKGAEVPMGGGKGSVDHYVAAVKKGMILFELTGITEEQAKEALRLASHKLPVHTLFIKG